MIEVVGDIFSFKADIYCVTTNAIINKNGNAVMGAGVAKAFRDRFKNIDHVLARQLETRGNVVSIIWGDPFILSFPTKHDWKDKSDLKLIEKSLQELLTYDGVIILPRPGCQNGGLDWYRDVKPLCEKYLTNNRFMVVSK